MGTKQSRNITERKSTTDETTQEDIRKAILFPNFGASTFIRQLTNEKLQADNQIDTCCSVFLTSMSRCDEFCSLDAEFESLRNNHQFYDIPKPREMLTRIWKHDEVRQLLLEKYCNNWRLENLEIFMQHLLNGNFDRKLENPLIYATPRTTGVIQTDFTYSNPKIIDEDVKLQLYEIGGSRSEWKKVMVCFEDLSYLFFFYSLSDFDNTYFEIEHQLHRYSYISNSNNFLKLNTNRRVILIFTKPDALQSKLKRGVLYKNETKYEMREELKLISNENEKNVINSIVSAFMSEYEAEFHIVNLLSKDEVKEVADLIFGRKAHFPFISKCLRRGEGFRAAMWKMAANRKLEDVSIKAEDT